MLAPPALLALGAGSVVCALTATASLLGWPANLAVPRRRSWVAPLPPAAAEQLLAQVPPGAAVRVEAVADAAALAFARAAVQLLEAEGRLVETPHPAIVQGIAGTGVLHFVTQRHHSILVLHTPFADAAGQACRQHGPERP